MAAPTFVAEYESAWNTTTTPKTISVTVVTGDVLVICGMAELNTSISTPTGGGLTYTLRQSIAVTDYCACYVYTAVATSSQTFTLSVGRGATSAWYGFNCLRFSGSAGIGASAKTNVLSGAPSLALTTTGASSAIVTANGDWNGGDGASRTWRTINSITPTAANTLERTYFRDAAHYATYVAYWNNVGTAGSKTTGLTAPATQKYSIISVEVLGSTQGQAAIAVNVVVAGTGARKSQGVAAIAVNVAAAGTGTRKSQGTAAFTNNVTVAASGVAKRQGVAALSVNVAAAGVGVADRQGVAALSMLVAIAASGVAEAQGSGSLVSNVLLGSVGSAPEEGSASGSAAFGVNVGVAASGVARSVGVSAFAVNTLLSASGVSRRQGVASLSVNITVASVGLKRTFGIAAFSLLTQLASSGVSSQGIGSASFAILLTLRASSAVAATLPIEDLLELDSDYVVTLIVSSPVRLIAAPAVTLTAEPYGALTVDELAQLKEDYVVSVLSESPSGLDHAYVVMLGSEDEIPLDSDPEVELTWTH